MNPQFLSAFHNKRKQQFPEMEKKKKMLSAYKIGRITFSLNPKKPPPTALSVGTKSEFLKEFTAR